MVDTMSSYWSHSTVVLGFHGYVNLLINPTRGKAADTTMQELSVSNNNPISQHPGNFHNFRITNIFPTGA